MLAQGAAIVDVGAESTRPGAEPLSEEEEWQRLEPVLSRLVPEYGGRISVDTYHPRTALYALSFGRVIINDITGMNNPDMIDIVAAHRASCIVSHLPGRDVQAAHRGELLDEVRPIADDLLAKKAELVDEGLDPDQVIIDPGIGFGKTPELNWRLREFARDVPGHPVMIGYSRKRFLGENRMELGPNLDAGRIAVDAGAAYLRVHDVAGHRKLLYTRA